MLAWWSQRETFLNFAGRAEEIRRITYRTAEDFKGWSAEKARALEQFGPYGIYNIPVLLDLIIEDDSPIAFAGFCELVRIQDVHTGQEPVARVWRVWKANPSRKTRLLLISDWWATNAAKYSGLSELRAAIDQRVRQICAELGKTR